MNTLYSFLKLGEVNNFRIITPPYQYYCHSQHTMYEGSKLHCQKLKCRAIASTILELPPDEYVCELCKTAKSKPRWIIGVINRLDGNFKLIDIGYNWFTKIRELVLNPDFGDPKHYDICMKNNKGHCTVLAVSKTPLTECEQLLQNNINHDYLRSLCDPTSDLEYLQERINTIMLKSNTSDNQEKND